MLERVLDRAIQVHGALGITDDTLLAYFYRHERGARIYDGPDEVHKMVVAKRILQAATASSVVSATRSTSRARCAPARSSTSRSSAAFLASELGLAARVAVEQFPAATRT